MGIQKRYLHKAVAEFLAEKMVFVGGPRQVGKTTLCLQFVRPSTVASPWYLNWDNLDDRHKIKNNELPTSSQFLPISTKLGLKKRPSLCFDELHKYLHWRQLVKGLYDKHHDRYRFLVTGSARLDHYRRGGDSLMGRYYYLRLHPFTVNELPSLSDAKVLLRFGGFPEPLFKASERHLKLWHRQRLYRLVHDDVRELANVTQLNNIELLAGQLPEHVASPLSINNLSRTLGVHHSTVVRWLHTLDNLYYSYRVPPYGRARIRAVKKEQKLYLWDWSAVPSQGPRFENMVASHLLKYCHYLEDTQGHQMELRFLRDTDGRELDFVVLKDQKPQFAVECKLSDKALSPHIYYFKERTSIPHFYQVHMGHKHIEKEKGITIIPFARFVQDILQSQLN